MKKEALWTKNFVLVSAANFFLFVSYYSLLVTLPTAAMNEFYTTASVAGLFNTFFLASAIIIRPFIGSWIDKYGKKFVLVVSYIIFAIVSVLYGFFESVAILLMLRFLQGIGFGIATTGSGGIVADIIPESRKGEGIGYFVMSFNISMFVGPFIGITTYSNFGILALFIIVAICSFLSLICSLLIKLPLERIAKETTNRKEKPPIIEKGAVPVSFTAAYFAISYAAVLSFMAVFADERGLGNVSGYFFAVFAIVLIMTRPFTGVWFDRYGPNAVIYPAIIVYSCGMLALGLSHHVITFFLAAALIGVGWGTLYSSFQTVAIQRSNPNRSSVATATYLSIFDIGIGGGSYLVGLLAKYINLGSMYIYLSIYIILGIGVYFWAQREKREEEYTKVHHEA